MDSIFKTFLFIAGGAGLIIVLGVIALFWIAKAATEEGTVSGNKGRTADGNQEHDEGRHE